MKVIVIGATGTIGSAVVSAISQRHEVLQASHSRSPLKIDLSQKDSIIAMFRAAGRVDAVVCAAGLAQFATLAQLSDEDFELGLRSKLMGQVNVVRLGMEFVNDGGSFTITSGILARTPMPGSAAISLVNAGLEGFMRAAALEAPRGIRVNAVSPPWVQETLKKLGMDPSIGLPAAEVARAYVRSLEGKETGIVIEPEK